MNAMPNLEIICSRVVDSYKKIYGDDIQGIYLYGSYARGDYNEDSDIDFAAIVKGERPQWNEKRSKLLHETGEIDLEYDVFISPKVISAEYFEKYVGELPYYKNILKEGKRLAWFDEISAWKVGRISWGIENAFAKWQL